MARSILFLVFIHIAFGFSKQTHLNVLVDLDTTIADAIEQNIIENIVLVYNKKSKQKLTYSYKTLPFDKIFTYMDTCSKNNVMSLSTITVTKERKKNYDFSSIYIPSKTVVFTINKNKNLSPDSWKKKGIRIAFQKNTIHGKIINQMKKKYKITPIPLYSYTQIVKALQSKKIKYGIGDNTEIWNDDGLHIIDQTELQYGDGIAIMYPKGSPLKDELEKYLNYYIHSKKFYRFLKTTYGNDVTEYFQNNLR